MSTTIGLSLSAFTELLLDEFEIYQGHWRAVIETDPDTGDYISLNIVSCHPEAPGVIDAAAPRKHYVKRGRPGPRKLP